MDGQWSSPDLAALLSLAALNRESLDLAGGPLASPDRSCREPSCIDRGATPSRAAAGTSPPTTTSATTSTACSSTRR